MLFTDLACCTGCLGAVGVRGDVSALEWYGACIDRACADGACVDGACVDGACVDGACVDGACADGACTDKACTDKAFCGASCGAYCVAYGCPLLAFPQELSFF